MTTRDQRHGWRKVLFENGLSLAFALLFLGALAGQALAGHARFNRELLDDGFAPVSLGGYVTSSAFGVDVLENWQSEFLQFLVFIVATVWLVQRGSPESKPLDRAGRESDAQQRVGRFAGPAAPRAARGHGLRRTLYSHSLALVMGAVFVTSWLGQSLAGAVVYSDEQVRGGHDPVSWAQYLRLPDFWDRTLQNWQSEFLAVLAMVILSVYLRERGSPESKPVGAPHDATGVAG
ncbi:conserved hypothetical protein [Xylanimonas cellulosilytica DSM 15894]|uniref:Uncharacterized protein n=1 Tax=Xylanimonas cellulosilytica (strain DSM 15894 / JCM 12276 / CECT 5975 / KCTC 9989 / LMG 20990 / NBRC 107835 / XIL07) TaxID=446471 RepID=D1BRI0_XYLCX|nr:DUF6766 family protein [Xylanimonas cellulosilytica]ACZ30435.1 conserved hypothetical protein [Xylanimonas cellulosilytica DSM 15894]